jgi:hypothetical protein
VLYLQNVMELAETGTPNQLFAELEKMVKAEVGAIIFSCSTFDLKAGQSRRVYTNMPEIYPVSGLKEIIPNAWTQVVLDQRQTFVANSLDVIKEVFPDHAIIGSLGCGSVINMPVFLSGYFLGTVNILHEPDFYTAAKVQTLQDLRHAAMLAFASLLIISTKG